MPSFWDGLFSGAMGRFREGTLPLIIMVLLDFLSLSQAWKGNAGVLQKESLSHIHVFLGGRG